MYKNVHSANWSLTFSFVSKIDSHCQIFDSNKKKCIWPVSGVLEFLKAKS